MPNWKAFLQIEYCHCQHYSSGHSNIRGTRRTFNPNCPRLKGECMGKGLFMGEQTGVGQRTIKSLHCFTMGPRKE